MSSGRARLRRVVQARPAAPRPGRVHRLLLGATVLLATVITGLATTARAQELGPEQVIASTTRHHPRVQAAMAREDVAEAALLAARGGFAPSLSAYGALRTGGYYDLRRVDVELRQPTPVWGAEVYAGYRYGRGETPERYPTYYDDQ